MIRILYPRKEYTSTYEIPFASLYKNGVRGVIFDIDNTLVRHGAPADKRSIELFNAIHEMGFKTCLLSNNKEPRVKPYADMVNSPYIYKAGKPSVKGYYQAMKTMGTDRHNTVFVGDQLFTDILGANKAGIYTILVHPIHKSEEIQIVIKRFLEKPILFFYHMNKR